MLKSHFIEKSPSLLGDEKVFSRKLVIVLQIQNVLEKRRQNKEKKQS